jgi:hypothetical protein
VRDQPLTKSLGEDQSRSGRYSGNSCNTRVSRTWRGGRAVECGGLEITYCRLDTFPQATFEHDSD